MVESQLQIWTSIACFEVRGDKVCWWLYILVQYAAPASLTLRIRSLPTGLRWHIRCRDAIPSYINASRLNQTLNSRWKLVSIVHSQSINTYHVLIFLHSCHLSWLTRSWLFGRPFSGLLWLAVGPRIRPLHDAWQLVLRSVSLECISDWRAYLCGWFTLGTGRVGSAGPGACSIRGPAAGLVWSWVGPERLKLLFPRPVPSFSCINCHYGFKVSHVWASKVCLPLSMGMEPPERICRV